MADKYACLECGFIHEEVIKKDWYAHERSTGMCGGSRPLAGTVKEQGIYTFRECPKCKDKKPLKHEPDKDGALCRKCHKGHLVGLHRGGGPIGSIMRSYVCDYCKNECNEVIYRG